MIKEGGFLDRILPGKEKRRRARQATPLTMPMPTAQQKPSEPHAERPANNDAQEAESKRLDAEKRARERHEEVVRLMYDTFMELPEETRQKMEEKADRDDEERRRRRRGWNTDYPRWTWSKDNEKE